MKIIGFFSDMKAANATISELKSNGISKAYIDMNDHNIESRNTFTSLVNTEFASNLSDLTFGSDINCKVVVDIEDKNEDEVTKIIKNMGGTLHNTL